MTPECPDITYEETTDMAAGKKYRFAGDLRWTPLSRQLPTGNKI
jgi:hypothetical protein